MRHLSAALFCFVFLYISFFQSGRAADFTQGGKACRNPLSSRSSDETTRFRKRSGPFCSAIWCVSRCDTHCFATPFRSIFIVFHPKIKGISVHSDCTHRRAGTQLHRSQRVMVARARTAYLRGFRLQFCQRHSRHSYSPQSAGCGKVFAAASQLGFYDCLTPRARPPPHRPCRPHVKIAGAKRMLFGKMR